MVRIAILDLSYWPPEHMSGQPKFGEVLRDWVARGLPQADLPVLDIVEGTPLPAGGDYDGYVISGSDKGVYDDPPWMNGLRKFLLDARQASKPLLGICFGHQIMADVFGGKAEKVGPPEVGVREFDMDGRKVKAHVWHQDQVTDVPPDAQIIASASYCAISGLRYSFPALSVQFHPEYSAEFMSSFLRRSRGAVLSEEHTDKALEELSGSDVPPELFAGQVGHFFRETLTDKAA